MISLLLQPLFAHPQDSSYVGHAVLAELDGEHLRTEFQFEVPNTAVARESGDPVESLYAQLVSGVSIKVNGKSIEPQFQTLPVTHEGEFTQFVLRSDTVLPLEPLAIEFGNATFPEIPSVFRADLRISGDWRATESSVLHTAPDLWHLDESLRKVTLTLEPRSWGFGAPLPLKDANERYQGFGALFAIVSALLTAAGLWIRQRQALQNGRMP